MIQSCHFQREEGGNNKLYGSMMDPHHPVFRGWVHHDKATIDRIMLRFRPIAPKPLLMDGSASDSTNTDTTATLLSKRRPKRKYVRANKTNNNNNNNSNSNSNSRRKCKTPASKASDEENRKAIRFDVGETLSFPEDIEESATKLMMSFELPTKNNLGLSLGLGLGGGGGPDPAVESWVVVNGVTEMTVVEVTGGGGRGEGGGLLGSTDGEKMRNLETDTCPGMISDGMHRVQWVNLAYKRMVDPGRAVSEMVVRLVLNENIPVVWSVFACTVRVVYTWRKEKYSKTMPCDVWKMDFGGFAWRFDTKAALCLGR